MGNEKTSGAELENKTSRRERGADRLARAIETARGVPYAGWEENRRSGGNYCDIMLSLYDEHLRLAADESAERVTEEVEEDAGAAEASERWPRWGRLRHEWREGVCGITRNLITQAVNAVLGDLAPFLDQLSDVAGSVDQLRVAGGQATQGAAVSRPQAAPTGELGVVEQQLEDWVRRVAACPDPKLHAAYFKVALRHLDLSNQVQGDVATFQVKLEDEVAPVLHQIAKAAQADAADQGSGVQKYAVYAYFPDDKLYVPRKIFRVVPSDLPTENDADLLSRDEMRPLLPNWLSKPLDVEAILNFGSAVALAQLRRSGEVVETLRERLELAKVQLGGLPKKGEDVLVLENDLWVEKTVCNEFYCGPHDQPGFGVAGSGVIYTAGSFRKTWRLATTVVDQVKSERRGS